MSVQPDRRRGGKHFQRERQRKTELEEVRQTRKANVTEEEEETGKDNAKKNSLPQLS